MRITDRLSKELDKELEPARRKLGLLCFVLVWPFGLVWLGGLFAFNAGGDPHNHGLRLLAWAGQAGFCFCQAGYFLANRRPLVRLPGVAAAIVGVCTAGLVTIGIIWPRVFWS